jgi:hypothetical protein
MRKFLVSLVVAIVGVVSFAVVATATKPTGHKVTICHATASQTNPYVKESVDVASIQDFQGGSSGHGSSGVNANDIIPGFTYGTFVFPGLNLGFIGSYTIGNKTVNVNASGTAIYDNGCKVPGSNPTPDPTPTPGGGGEKGGGGDTSTGTIPTVPTTGVGDAAGA